MRLSTCVALLMSVAILGVAVSSRAQTVVETTVTQARVSVEAEVVTTTTVVTSPEPSAVVVVSEPAPVVQQEAVPVVQQESVDEDPVVPLLNLRGELHMVGGDYDTLATGASAMLGLSFGDGFQGGVVLGYLAGFGFHDPSEVNLSLEAARDFSPDANLGFVLLARVGSAFILEPEPQDVGIRLVAQLGVGGRVSIDRHLAITFDMRGLFRYRPNVDHARGAEVAAGAVISLGLMLRLD